MQDELRDKVMDFFQTPKEAMRLSRLVIDELTAIDGYALIPEYIQTAIERKCAVLYAAGAIHALRHREEIEQ